MITNDDCKWANTKQAELTAIAGKWAKKHSVKALQSFSDYYDRLISELDDSKYLSYVERKTRTLALENMRFVARFAITIKESKGK
jgi:hypothetical protein